MTVAVGMEMAAEATAAAGMETAVEATVAAGMETAVEMIVAAEMETVVEATVAAEMETTAEMIVAAEIPMADIITAEGVLKTGNPADRMTAAARKSGPAARWTTAAVTGMAARLPG